MFIQLVYVFSLMLSSVFSDQEAYKGGPDHEGGIFTVEAPLHASNVQVVDPVTGYVLISLTLTNYFFFFFAQSERFLILSIMIIVSVSGGLVRLV